MSTKADLREVLLARRRTRGNDERAAAADALAQHASSLPSLAGARRVAAYLSMPAEPGTGPLLDLLAQRGVEVIVPISLPDHTLDWVLLEPGAPLTATGLGIPEPAGERLGADALGKVDLVLVPALAVDHAGHRLGRGAGYYDRALGAATAPICAVVFADELLESVPHEPHDLPVDLVLTPHGIFRPDRRVGP